MSVSSASTHSRLASPFYRTGDSSTEYHSKYGSSSFSSRSPSLDNGFSSGTLPRRYVSTSSTARPLPVGPSSAAYDSSSSASPSSSSSVRSIPIRYNETSSTSTLGRRIASTAASSKPPLPTSAIDRISSSLGSRYSSSNNSDLLPPPMSINRYIRSSSTDRSSVSPSIHQRHSSTDDHQYRRLPISTNIETFERLSDTRPYSATYASSRRPSTAGYEDYLHARSPSPISSQRSYMNGTSTMRIVPIHFDREREGEHRDVLASLMTSPSASGGIGTGVSSGTAGGSMSQTGLYRSRVGAISVPDVPTYARVHIDDTTSTAANLNSTSPNNGYSNGSRRNSLTNSSMERQELEDDDDENKDDAAAKEEAELRRKYSPANYRRPSDNDNWSATRYVSSVEADSRPTGRQVTSSETANWPSSRLTASATSNNPAGSGANNAFVKNEPSRSSTSSVDSSESSRLSSGRSSNISEGGGNTRYGESNRFIRDDDNNDSKKCGLTGLRNLGNTCFMNSVIQCLSNTRPLRDYCLHSSSTLSTDINNNTTSRMKGALIKAFRELLSELWSTTKGGYVSPDRFKTQIQKFAPRFTGYNQQDAQEFLRYLLQGLHEDINRVQPRPPALPPIEDSLPDSQKALESWKRYLRVDESKVVDIFVGQLKSELKCTHCGNVSTTFDPFWDLSLPIPQDTRRNQVTLNDCLDAFTKEEVLDGDEKPTCDVCKTRRRCTKKFSIQKYPSVLVVHLKRFSGERYRSRLSTLVDFPLTKLDLSAYAGVKSAVTPTYDLYAVSNHSGTPMTGHYTAYCKNPQSGRWYLFDDSRVSPVNDRSVISSEAYVLFYELSASGSSSRL